MVHIIERPPIPFTTPIYEMSHNASVEIHGEAFPGPNNGFVVDFPSNDGIALHFNVRMGNCGERTIVVNSFHHGHWKHEDRHHNHLHFGHHFQLCITNHHTHFSIHMNGRHICHFHHRESPHHIRALHVRGDLVIHKVHMDHFAHHNGGGIQVGGIVAAPMAPVVVQPPPPVMPVYQPVQPIMPVYQPVMRQPEVVIIEEEHHHHHRRGPLHRLFHPHHHHHCD